MDRNLYVSECERQLHDQTVYSPLVENPIPFIESNLTSLLHSLYNDGVITENMYRFASPTDSKPARFYLLPKIHKSGVPGRPVVSCCGTATEGASELVDHFLKPLLPVIPTYIRDSYDFLDKLCAYGSIGPNTLLVTIDVVALYPSIPHIQGLEALRDFLSEHGWPVRKVDGICSLAKLVLENNVLELDNKLFRQVSGTAIGTKFAPSYANIFMHIFERSFFDKCALQPSVVFRFIDDYFLLWDHGLECLNHFIDLLNAECTSLRFIHTSSSVSVDFLDVIITKNPDFSISTDLFVKNTDTHQYLHNSSCHPHHIKRSIAFSQALRIKRICSDPLRARERCRELCHWLIRRGFSKCKVMAHISKALRPPPRRETPHIPVDTRKIPLVLTYHTGLPDIGAILRKFKPVLLPSPVTQKLSLQHILSFRQPPNFRSRLVLARLSGPRPASARESLKPSPSPCGEKRCNLCSCFNTNTFSSSKVTGNRFTCVNAGASCKTRWCIYVISCDSCGCHYTGCTNNLRLRMNNHKSALEDSRSGKLTQTNCHLLYSYLSACESSLSFQIVQVFQEWTLQREAKRDWIYRLDTLAPRGLNVDDGTYSQNRKIRFKRN
ncbi:hypothetical protein HOLleu_04569 [Holothuria leucospilota]|uniref:Reverse transcriptase domain-containing protein n=1 Tax=Holothuria leucospilota TaxID=206669 RepID=A0A9Q1HKW5_HOLLE|nr:hypothetical protein HOLleu_04569 [Holothuria leucospilota]